jgi:hypothetical protein
MRSGKAVSVAKCSDWLSFAEDGVPWDASLGTGPLRRLREA